jgi:hypothetical protein
MADAKSDLNAFLFGSDAPLSELNNSAGGTASLTYPSELTENGNHFLKFSPVKYDRKNRNANADQNTLLGIHLPIPANIQTSYGANWGEVELGQVGNLLADSSSSSAQTLSRIMNDTKNVTVAGVTKAASEVIQTLKPTMIRNTVKMLGDTVGIKGVEAYDVSKGQAVNPHQAALFTGVGFRSHSFAFKLVARSPDESETIHKIIKAFKYCMHPELVGDKGTMFEFPYEWIIKFSSSVRKYAYDFTPCALTNFSATYNGQGSPVFYEHTGAPIQVDISMQFKEVEIITKAKLKREGRGESFGKGSRESKDIAAGGAKATAAGGEATTTGGSF